MKLKISLIGKSNVGKSSLFNKLTKNKSLVNSEFGTTRDRKYGNFIYNKNIIIIDTGSLNHPNIKLKKEIYNQTIKAIEESDIIFFIIECSTNVISVDHKILKMLKNYNKDLVLIINKIDLYKNKFSFNNFKIKNIYYISIKKNIGLNKLNKFLISKKKIIKNNKNNFEKINNLSNINIVVLGKSNVGKSTLINKITKSNRLVVSDYPGTTLENIDINFNTNIYNYIFTDTLGINNKLGFIKGNYKLTLNDLINKKIIYSNIILFILDIVNNISLKELNFINYLNKLGKIFIILINKIDLLNKKNFLNYKIILNKKLSFIKNVKIIYISILNETNFNNLINLINNLFKKSNIKFKTKTINNFLKEISKSEIFYTKNKLRPKLKYAYIISNNPFKLIIHGNNLFKLDKSHKKYIEKYFINKLNIKNIPIKILLKNN